MVPTKQDPVCSECGYDLRASATVGRCPECGNFFDMRRGQGIKQPLDAQERAERFLAKLRTVVLAVMAFLLIACTGVFSYFVGSHANLSQSVGTLAVFSVLLVLAAVTSYYAQREDASPPFDPKGPVTPIKKTCRQCGHDLTHAGPRGKCPNCGNYFDRATRVGFGYEEAQTQLRQARLERVKRYIAVAAGVLLLATGSMLYLHVQGPRSTMWTGLVLAVLVLLILAAHTQVTPKKAMELDRDRSGPLLPPR